jgi:hypothetical protein
VLVGCGRSGSGFHTTFLFFGPYCVLLLDGPMTSAARLSISIGNVKLALVT